MAKSIINPAAYQMKFNLTGWTCHGVRLTNPDPESWLNSSTGRPKPQSNTQDKLSLHLPDEAIESLCHTIMTHLASQPAGTMSSPPTCKQTKPITHHPRSPPGRSALILLHCELQHLVIQAWPHRHTSCQHQSLLHEDASANVCTDTKAVSRRALPNWDSSAHKLSDLESDIETSIGTSTQEQMLSVP